MAGIQGHYKDEVLDQIAHRGNVAQFVSFSPDLTQRFAWVRGYEPNTSLGSPQQAIDHLLAASPEHSVNVRSFAPDNPKSREFIYGLTNLQDVLAKVKTLAGAGLTTIVNETVDIHDGGVSGVAYGDDFEFAPEDTPRCVEKPGTAAFPRALGLRFLNIVYGIAPRLPEDESLRVEWSIHPLKRGFRHEHTILWEIEEQGRGGASNSIEGTIQWPNRFSRFMGDKAYGLLIGHLLDLPVPRTHVLARRIAPFTFGHDTGNSEVWIRTCPNEQVPGLFTTAKGWLDPYRLMQTEDPDCTKISALLCQQGVEAKYSGSLVAQADLSPYIEGVSGQGDDFMGGRRAPERLPVIVRRGVREVYERASISLGPVRCEWVWDGARVWLVQLHKGKSHSQGRVIYPGDYENLHYFEVKEGLEALRNLVEEVKGTGDGIALIGKVGITSHFGDVLRRAEIPSRLETSTSPLEV